MAANALELSPHSVMQEQDRRRHVIGGEGRMGGRKG